MLRNLKEETLSIDEVRFNDSNENHLGGIVIEWSANIGNGELDVYKDTESGNLEAITEYMCTNEDKTFLKIILEKLFNMYKLNISKIPVYNLDSVTVEHVVITGDSASMKPGMYIRYRHTMITTQDNILGLVHENAINDYDVKTKRFISVIISRLLNMIEVVR